MKLTATYKGLITGILMAIVSLLLFFGFKQEPNGATQLMVIGIFILGVLWSLVAFARRSGSTKFKEYFSEGFKTFIVATLIIVLYSALFYKFNPQILEAVIAENELLVAKAGDKTPAEIKANSESLRSIFMPMTISLTTVTYLFFGALTSVLGGLFIKMQQSNRKINTTEIVAK